MFLNFKAIKGISATSRNEKVIVRPISTEVSVSMSLIHSLVGKILTNGIVMKNRVFAGVGKPMNLSVCLVSILNFASLTAENIVTKKPSNGM